MLEIVDGAVGMQKISGELRCRRVWSAAGEATVRQASQKECALECSWWQALCGSGAWSGRRIVVALFGRSGDRFELKADYLTCDGRIHPVFGWAGSRGTLAFSMASPAAAPRALPAAASSAGHAQPRRAHSAPPRIRQPVARVSLGSVRPKPVYRTEEDSAGEEHQVAPVAKLLEALERDTDHIKDSVVGWKRRCPSGALFKAPRRVQKRGASLEWVADEAMLQSICTGS